MQILTTIFSLLLFVKLAYCINDYNLPNWLSSNRLQILRTRRQIFGANWQNQNNFNRRARRHPQFNNDDDDDFFVFDAVDDEPEEEQFEPTTPFRPPFIPTPSATPPTPASFPNTPRSRCEDDCFITPEYNPICGTDNMTYFSMGRLECAQRCGKSVNIRHMGKCTKRRFL